MSPHTIVSREEWIAARDTAMVAISRAPLPKLAAFKQRMGWTFDWLSSGGNAFNYDYGVSFTPEQIARGGNYNFGTTPLEVRKRPESACSIATRPGTSTTPIPVTRAAST